MHNCRIKRYPDGRCDIVAARVPFGGGDVVRYADFNSCEDAPMDPERAYAARERDAIQAGDAVEPLSAETDRAKAANAERAKRRARVAVRDLGRCNEFAYFVTLTLDRRKVDRYDPAAVVGKLNRWLDNCVRRHGLAYVLVPELHRDGAIHFHGFFNGALRAVDSGHKDKQGHTVFNLPGWTLGFSTAIALYGSREAAVAYCCKYVVKQQDRIGGRWYYSGGALRRPTVEWCDVDFDDFVQVPGASVFQVPELDTKFAALSTDAAAEDLTSQESCDVKGIPLTQFAKAGQFDFFGTVKPSPESLRRSASGGPGGPGDPRKSGEKGADHDNGIPAQPGG